MERFSRRTFMKLTAFTVGILAFAPFRTLLGQNNVEWVSVGKVDDFKIGKPVLMQEGVKKPVIIFREEKGFSALSPICTHKGCTVNVKKNGIYACPCHGSQFDYEGRVVKGPAKRNLESYMVKISDTNEVMVGQ
jgi:cytochrome b6-f complex iron-sulfur subunit